MSTEHRTVRENKVSRGRKTASNPREVDRPVAKVEETCRDAFGACGYLSQKVGERQRRGMNDCFACCLQRPVQKVEERQRGGEEVRTSGINEVKGEGMTERDKRTYEPREPASRR